MNNSHRREDPLEEGKHDAMSDVLSCQDVADYLGLHVKTVREYVARGEIRAAMLGRRYRIRKEWVIEFLEQISQS